MNKQDDLFEKILRNTKTAEIDYFLMVHKDAIKKAIAINVSIKSIHATIMNESDVKVSYSAFLKKIKLLLKLENVNIVQNNNTKNDTSAELKNTNQVLNEPLIIKSTQKKFEYKNDKLNDI